MDMITFELIAVIALVLLAFGDLIVGVVNDAVNFLNSAIGAKVAKMSTIMIIASIGVIIGATFSDGIIEVARKGIFFPEMFSLDEAIIIFTAVAITDIVLLDLYSTFGLPTSTTVSIVFELLGAAFVLAWWKIGDFNEAWTVINNASAIKIIVGILLSVAVAFVIGFIGQVITRMIFTFDYKKRFNKWGFLWSGVALTCLLFFIILKGGKHATFMTPDIKKWISLNYMNIVWGAFIFFSTLSFILIKLKVNILKVIVLIGTGSLAMAFAGNDLANFIGVSIAGVHAFFGSDLSGTLPTPSWILILAGSVMAIAMFMSRKAQTVVSTSVDLTSHDKQVMEKWNPSIFVKKFTELVMFLYKLLMYITPKRLRKWFFKRWETSNGHMHNGSAFDLLRAAVNLMIAAVLISLATSMKLPLSTTYVTFMVAMGTALADGAWDGVCAPYRLSGIITVVGGWFFTALLAFIFTGLTVSILYLTRIYGLVLLILIVFVMVYKLFYVHKKRHAKASRQQELF